MKQKLLFAYYKALASLARRYLRKHKPYIIGINGSVGKTSCRMIIYQTLRQFLPELKVYTSSKNFNGELGLPLSIFQIEHWDPTLWTFISTLVKVRWITLRGKTPYQCIILEYGIDRPKEMEFLLSVAKPDIGVFTAIDAVHSEQFGNPAEIAKEEVKMIKHTKEHAFLNANDHYAQQLHPMIHIDTITYQTEGHEKSAHIRFEHEKFVKYHDAIGVDIDLHIQKQHYTIQTNLLGKPNYGYIGVALAIAEIVSWKPALSKEKLQFPAHMTLEYQLQPGRMSIFPGKEKSIIIDSTYNSSPLSVKKLIDAVHNMKTQLFPERKVMLVLGDMRELGDLTEREHRRIAGYVSQIADELFLVGESMQKYLADELGKIGYDTTKIHIFTSSLEAGKAVLHRLQKLPEECLVVCKGSQNTIFLEETVKHLLQNPADHAKLTRQSARWQAKKKRFFEQN